MQHFRRYLLGTFNRNNKAFKFNTFGTSFEITTYFYLTDQGIHNHRTYSKLNRADHKEILTFIYQHRKDILKIYDGINSEHIKENIFRVNNYYYKETDHIKAIKSFARETRTPGV